jgi:exosortase/archaeosortase family protein
MARSSARAAAGHRPVLVFLGKCLAYWGVALLLVSRVKAIEEAGISLTLGTLQLVMKLFHQQVERSGNMLYAGGASVEIVSDCSPHMPYLIFAGVVLAFPATWRQRLMGLVFGAVVIHAFNTIRILALIGILSWRRSWFEFAHIYLWQTGTIVVVFVTFALWLRALGRTARPVT